MLNVSCMHVVLSLKAELSFFNIKKGNRTDFDPKELSNFHKFFRPLPLKFQGI